MAYRRFDISKIETGPAKVAKVAKVEADTRPTFAKFATFARAEPQNENLDGVIQERAAILEYDEGLSREEAEQLAAGQVRDQRRLADAYDAAQERGEVAHQGRPEKVGGSDLKPTIADIGLSKQQRSEARIIRDGASPPVMHPVGWLPEPSPGVTILRPGVELPATEYDARINAMLATLPGGSPEAQRLDFARRKGWVIDCDGERIFTKGRG